MDNDLIVKAGIVTEWMDDPNNGKQGVNEECRKEAWLACNLNMEIFILFKAMTTLVFVSILFALL